MTPLEIIQTLRLAVQTISEGVRLVHDASPNSAEDALDTLNSSGVNAATMVDKIDAVSLTLAQVHVKQLHRAAQETAAAIENPRWTAPEKEREIRRLASIGLQQISYFQAVLNPLGTNVETLKNYFELNAKLQ